MSNMRAPGTPESGLEDIKATLCAKLIAMLRAGKIPVTKGFEPDCDANRDEAVGMLTPDRLSVHIRHIHGYNTILCMQLKLEGHDPMRPDHIKIWVDDVREEILDSLTEEDLALLWENTMVEDIEAYERILERDAEKERQKHGDPDFSYMPELRRKLASDKQSILDGSNKKSEGPMRPHIQLIKWA